MKSLRFSLIFCLLFALLSLESTEAQRRGAARSRRPQRQGQTASERRTVRSRRSPSSTRKAPVTFYKANAVVREVHEVRADFVISGDQWPQAAPGSAVTITYSYSNLLDGTLRGLSSDQVKSAIEEAFALWASVAPLQFVELEDTGPAVADGSYPASNHADIRLGHHTIDGANGGVLAHAYLPYSVSDGAAGDVHFDTPEDWGAADGGQFLETALHEIGHALGMEHESEANAIMNPSLVGRFTGLGVGFLLEDDIAGIRAIYGEGVGSVTPLQSETDTEAEGEPEEEPSGDGESTDDGATDTSSAPSVTTSVDREQGTLVITGDAEANSLLLLGNRWFTLVCGLQGTQVDEQPWVIHFGVANIDCAMGGGEDSVSLLGVYATTIECALGGENDFLGVWFSRVNRVNANGGAGDDRYFGFGNWGATVTTTEFENEF